MKILVTGSAGFIGRAVVAELKARGHEAIAFDSPLDVRKFADVKEAAKDAAGIINLAGMLGTPELFGNEILASEVNILGALTVYDVGSILHIPVVQVGTGHKGQPNPYAITKGCAEDLGLARAQWKGEKITVVRAFHAYGEHQKAGPPHGTASVHKFFPTFACRALSGMPLELCGGGGQLIDPVHVTDCATVLVDALDGHYGEVLEAGNGRPIYVSQVARDIATAAGVTPEIEVTEQRDGEPLNDIVIARSPQCSNPWPYMVDETVEWYKSWLLSSR